MIFEETPQLLTWIKESGVDMAPFLSQDEWHYTPLDLRLFPLPSPNWNERATAAAMKSLLGPKPDEPGPPLEGLGDPWNELTAATVMRAFDRPPAGKGAAADEPIDPSTLGGHSPYEGDFQAIYAFRTRDNTMGAFQWVGINSPARGVKIRYKFVVSDAVMIASAAAAKPAALQASRRVDDPSVTTPIPRKVPHAEPKPAVGPDNPAEGKPAFVGGAKVTIAGKCIDENKSRWPECRCGCWWSSTLRGDDKRPVDPTQRPIAAVRTDAEGRFRFADLTKAADKATLLEAVAQLPGRATVVRPLNPADEDLKSVELGDAAGGHAARPDRG